MRLRIPGFLALSAALHGLALAAMAPAHPDPAASGGGGAVALMLGNALADLTAGGPAARPVPITAVARPVMPTAAQPAVSSPAAPQSPVPPDAAPASPQAALLPTTAPPRLAPAPAAPSLAPETSPQPRARPAIPAAAPGTAPRDARRGSDQDAPAARAQPGRGGPTPDPGQAGRDAYAAQVLGRIRATPALRSPGRGSALVAFVIGPGGRLATVRIARPSGQPALDQTALAHIRRAAPFPAPPPGAETRFTFDYVTR